MSLFETFYAQSFTLSIIYRLFSLAIGVPIDRLTNSPSQEEIGATATSALLSNDRNIRFVSQNEGPFLCFNAITVFRYCTRRGKNDGHCRIFKKRCPTIQCVDQLLLSLSMEQWNPLIDCYEALETRKDYVNFVNIRN